MDASSNSSTLMSICNRLLAMSALSLQMIQVSTSVFLVNSTPIGHQLAYQIATCDTSLAPPFLHSLILII